MLFVLLYCSCFWFCVCERGAGGAKGSLHTLSPPRQGCKGANFRIQPHSLQSSPIAACNHSAVLVQTWYRLLFLSNLDSPQQLSRLVVVLTHQNMINPSHSFLSHFILWASNLLETNTRLAAMPDMQLGSFKYSPMRF